MLTPSFSRRVAHHPLVLGLLLVATGAAQAVSGTVGDINPDDWTRVVVSTTGTPTYNAVPVDATGFSSGVVELAAGNQVTCALTSEGGIKCVGVLYYLRDEIGTSSAVSLVPLDVPGFS